MTTPPQKLLAIIGPTASGKTRLAAKVAAKVGAHVISADSRQVYRGLDIGSGKDLSDYVVDGHTVPYHLIDIATVGQEFNVFNYQQAFARIYEQLSQQRTPAILAGGSGLYIDAVLRGYALPHVPENPNLRQQLSQLTPDQLLQRLQTYRPLHNTTDALDPSRTIRAIEIEEYKAQNPVPAFAVPPSVVVCLDPPRHLLKSKITDRLKKRLNAGLVEEVEGLLAQGHTAQQLKFLGLEYKLVTRYVQGDLNYNDMYQKLNAAIHAFAKRQMTWYRRMEKQGVVLHRISQHPDHPAVIEKVMRWWQ